MKSISLILLGVALTLGFQLGKAKLFPTPNKDFARAMLTVKCQGDVCCTSVITKFLNKYSEQDFADVNAGDGAKTMSMSGDLFQELKECQGQ